MSSLVEGLGSALQSAAAHARDRTAAQVMEKGRLDYVTEVDREVDDLLFHRLSKLTPGVPVLSEERPIAGERFPEQAWLVDPIDGTHNMIVGIPFFSICAAFLECGAAQISGVLHVSTDELYLAERGRGAWLRDTRLRLPGRPPTLLALSSGVLDALIERPDLYHALREIGKLRNLGCQSLHLCAVARGEAALAVSAEAYLWDDAAARLVAEEAGAAYLSFTEARTHDRWAGMNAGLQSLCAHPSVLDDAERVFGSLWLDDSRSS